jgi:GNAT superfamily N-acetyltransferase
MAITVRKLDIADEEVANSFDCGDLGLNDYLKKYAVKNQQLHRYGMTYVALSSELTNRILGYYTIANSSIHRARMPEDALKGLPKYADIPAILLARFAVDKEFARRGIGHILMSHALDLTLSASQISAARYLFTEAYDSAVNWYAKYGFQEIGGSIGPNRHKMYLDLRVVEKAQGIALQTLFSSATIAS